MGNRRRPRSHASNPLREAGQWEPLFRPVAGLRRGLAWSAEQGGTLRASLSRKAGSRADTVAVTNRLDDARREAGDK